MTLPDKATFLMGTFVLAQRFLLGRQSHCALTHSINTGRGGSEQGTRKEQVLAVLLAHPRGQQRKAGREFTSSEV